MMRVAVIGAGAAGLASARRLGENPEFSFVVYEQTESVGGTWVYDERTGTDEFGLPIHTSMYKSLRTNLPKEVMGYPDFPITKPADRSYIPAASVLAFLREFAQAFGLTRHIQFRHVVRKVTRNENGWNVRVENLKEGKAFEENFDAVMICNGIGYYAETKKTAEDREKWPNLGVGPSEGPMMTMENVFASQLLSDSSQALEGLPDSLRMQLGPFNPQVQDSKTLSIHSLHASAFRLRYGNSYPRFPAHLIQHLQPQLFPSTVDQRLHFPPGAFRPFNVPAAQNKLFPSAFAPPLKSDAGAHDALQDISPATYVSGYYGAEMDDDSSFRSNSERDVDFPCGDQSSKLELSRSTSASTPSPQASSLKDEKVDACNGKPSDGGDVDNSESRGGRRGKLPLDPTSCPICGIMVLLGEAESHFFKELEKLSHISAITRERKYLYDKYNDVQSCFPGFGSSGIEENGHGTEMGIPRGRWETYQRIKSNRLSRLRIKNRKKKNGDPVCPVCNDKIQGSVEDINLHVEHCLKKHSDEAEEEEEENIDVEGDSEVYGEYEWTAGLLTTTATSSNHRACEKDEGISNPEGEDSSCVTPAQLSDSDTNAPEEDSARDRRRDKNPSLGQNTDNDFPKYSIPKSSNRA